MKRVTFKSNINCGSCIQKVTPTLNALDGVDDWRVDTTHPDKILSVEIDEISPTNIINALADIGFTAEFYSQD